MTLQTAMRESQLCLSLGVRNRLRLCRELFVKVQLLFQRGVRFVPSRGRRAGKSTVAEQKRRVVDREFSKHCHFESPGWELLPTCLHLEVAPQESVELVVVRDGDLSQFHGLLKLLQVDR